MKYGICAFVSFFLSFYALPCVDQGSLGFFSTNAPFIPFSKLNAGLTKAEFEEAKQKIQVIYAPIVASMDAELSIMGSYDFNVFKASTFREGNKWTVYLFGGIARHEKMTQDGLLLVTCHELGHHLGGAPKAIEWSSNEGQADYWATLKCLRRIFLNDDNAAIVAKLKIPEELFLACRTAWKNEDDKNICLRSGMAGLAVAKALADVAGDFWSPSYAKKDPSVVSVTNDKHPDAQCRLDTYLQGALCERSFAEDVSQVSVEEGTCHDSSDHAQGLRPLCWFKP